jgi:SAM-dependent methyltransferase
METIVMSTNSANPLLPAPLREKLACPACHGPMTVTAEAYACGSCKRTYAVDGGIPLLFHSHDWESKKKDVTEAIKAFYEATPFPNYDDTDTLWNLREKAEKGVFAKMLDEQVSDGAWIMEAGCGTGQLSNFLGIRPTRTVVGTDMCLNSLRLALGFKETNGLDNVRFLQMNLFEPVFAPDSFDLVICNGVLHHTGDPFGGFQSIARLVKPSGLIIIGLYNTWGRLTTDLRRLVFRLTGDRLKSLDPRLRKAGIGDVRKMTWFKDQYKNPHESKHSIGEVQKWFRKTGFEFVNAIPHAVAFDDFSAGEKLFEPRPAGSRADHFMVQMGLLAKGGPEGGFFTLIGKKS